MSDVRRHPRDGSTTRGRARRRWADARARAAGYLGSKRYEVIDQPDVLVELAEWESVEARSARKKAAMEGGFLAPLPDLMGAPFRVTVIRELS